MASVPRYDPIWHVISSSVEVISTINCYIKLTSLQECMTDNLGSYRVLEQLSVETVL